MIASLLALSLLLAGAGEDAGASGAPEVILWHAYRGTEREALEQIVADFNQQHSDVHIALLSIPYDALVDKVTAAIPRGRGPDLFISAHDTIGDWVEAKLLEPLDDRAGPQLLQEFFDETVPPLLYKGHLYGLPLAFKSCALFYNPDVVKQVPTTTDQMLAIARQVTNADQGIYGIVYETALLYFHAPVLFGFGGWLFDDDGVPQLDNQKNVDGALFAQALVQKEKVTPREVNGPLVAALVNQGKYAFAINGPWMLGDLDAKAPFAVAKLPTVSATGKPLRPFLSTEAVMLSAKGSKQELAWVVAQALTATDAARVRLLTGKQPVATRAAWRGVEDRTDKNLLAFKEQLRDTVATPNTPAMKATWSQFDIALNRTVNGNEDPKVALADAQRKVQSLLNVDTRQAQQKPTQTPAIVLLISLGAALLLLILFKLWRYGLRRLWREMVESRAAYAYAAPALLAMAALVLTPFFFGVGMGFYKHEWGKYSFVGLANYVDILGSTDSRFWFTLVITVIWTTLNVVLHLCIGMALALLLNRPTLKGKAIYRVLLIVPWAVPTYITALIWKGMFHPEFGAVNLLLGIKGFSWMAQTWSAFCANVVTNTWLGFPFMMVVTLGALQSIPTDLYEAASIDGATTWQRFSRITLPLLKPALAPAVLLGVVWTFNMFNVIYLVSGGAPDGKSDILITEAYRWAFERGRGGAFGYAAAYSTLIFLMLLGYTWVSSRVTRNIEGSLE